MFDTPLKSGKTNEMKDATIGSWVVSILVHANRHLGMIESAKGASGQRGTASVWRAGERGTLLIGGPSCVRPRIGLGAEDGVKRAEVITARLIQDERGWLRLAG